MQMVYTPRVDASKSVEKKIEKKYYIPTNIVIDKVGIALPVEQTVIADGAWEISENGVSHLISSAKPGEPKTIIMYGHNTNDRMGPIRWLSMGDEIQLQTSEKIHTYTITETHSLAPNELDVLTKDRGEALIIYTCDGFADKERFLIIAKPSQVE